MFVLHKHGNGIRPGVPCFTPSFLFSLYHHLPGVVEEGLGGFSSDEGLQGSNRMENPTTSGGRRVFELSASKLAEFHVALEVYR